MKLFKKLLTGFLCIAVPAYLFSQDFSNKGKDFWIGYGHHVRMFNNAPWPQANCISGVCPEKMQLYITSDVNTTGNVDIPGVGFSQSFSVTANQITTIDIPRSAALNDEGLYNRGIHVTALKPIVVYSFIYVNAISGATVCLPTNTLGREYYSVNFKQLSNEPNSHSYFFVVAADTGTTTVEITPSATTKNGSAANIPFTVNLTQGQAYQVLGQTGSSQGVDLTGSRIRSLNTGSGCKRIAVFCGSSKISIGCNDPSVGSSDNLYQQIYPTGVWGKTYVTVPPTTNGGNALTTYYRIIRPDPMAIVTLNGAILPGASFTNGFYYQFTSNTTNVISSSLPILVAQYFTTSGGNNATNCSNPANINDPEMIYLNPVEQTVTDVTLHSMQPAINTNITTHFLNVVLRNVPGAINSFQVDGVTYPASFTLVPQDPNYAYARISVPSQGHRVRCDSAFNIIAYGMGSAESYGYSGGTNLKDLYQFVSIANQFATVNFPATCKNAPFNFRIVFPYEPTQIQWVFGAALNAMGITDVTITNPVYDSTWIVNGRQVYRYSLPLQYTITTIGTYPIKVIANNPTPDGCSGVQEIDYDLQVFNPPSADFNFTTNGCVTSPVNFLDISNTGGRPVIQWNWNFGDAGTSNIQNPSHTYPAPGSYLATLSVITDVGCISDTMTKPINLTQSPQAKFGASLPRCTGKPITFTDSSTVSGGNVLAKWYWNFGDGSPQVIATNNAPQIHTYTSAGTYNATLKVETTSGCMSIVFTKQIIVNANPVASFSLNGNVCLPQGTANFVNGSSISDGTGPLMTYLWNFGNGNTSTVANPVYNYTTGGPFTVTLTATSNNGCVDDTVTTLSAIYAQPQAAFNAPAEVCLGAPVNFTDQSTAANSTVTQWNWNFGDAGTSNIQNPSHTYPAPGTYTVTLTITSGAGCISTTATRTVVVNPLPTANFTSSTPACVGRNITFTDASTANAGNLVKWTWNFGDGNTAVMSSPNPFVHSYANAGTYNVTLQVETNKGCISTILTKPVTVNILPDAGFISPEICLTDPAAPFVDTSKIATGNIATWLWNFGDPNANAGNPNTSTVQNPTHLYSVVGNYTATLIVASNNGCTDTISQTFTVNGSIPLANFTVQNANALCSNKDVVISDASTVDFGSLVKTEIYWDWTNDPTIKTTDNSPLSGKLYSHTYPEFGTPGTKTYTIRMVTYSGITCMNVMTKTVTVLATPALQFDPVNEICSNASSFQITQASITNGLTGSGVFSGPGVNSTGLFNPATAGAGTHTIRYTFTAANGCSNFIEQTIRVNPTPNANAGPDKVVLEGGQVQLTPAMNAGFPVTYSWTPPTGLSNPNAPDPMASPVDDITYTLRVTSDKGCATSDQVFVKVLKKPAIPNIFSPNGDGIHDKWVIGALDTYPGCTVEIFNRYGQRIYYSVGYSTPWDGTINGKPVPIGTYYYIVDPKNGRQKMTGYVDIVR